MKKGRKQLLAWMLCLIVALTDVSSMGLQAMAKEFVQENSVVDNGSSDATDSENGVNDESDEEIFETDDESEMQEEGVSDDDAQREVPTGADSDNQEDSKQTETDDTGNGTEDSEQFDAEEPDAEAEGSVTAPEEASVSENAVETVQQLEKAEAELDGVYQFGGAPLGKTAKNGGSSFIIESYSVDGEVNGVTIDEYIYQEALKRNEEIDISAYSIPTHTLLNVVSAVINEHPELYFVDSSFRYITNSDTDTVMTVFLTYNNTLDDVIFKAETKAALSTVKDGMSDLQKAIVLHDYLAVNCEYDETESENGTLPQESYSAYGALVNRTAVCQGYALAYKYLLNQAGIECYMVTSYVMEHVWNLVKLDGQYYQVDVTWDDPSRDLIGRALHAYMFCSDNVFQDDVHGHYDWRVTYGSEVVDYQATDTKYDNAFWSDINSPLVLTGNNWDDCYYVCYDAGAMAGKIKRITLSTVSNIGTDICNAGTWPMWESSEFYTSAFSGLFQNGNRLYYNDKTSIYSIDFDGANKKTEFTADTANGYIYGSALCQGKVLYSLHQTPVFSEKETVLIADVDITMETPSEIPVESITVSPSTLTLEKGKAAELEAVVTPANATDKNITWTSSDESIAEVENGVVTAVASGECTITASAGDKEAVCSVSVSENGSEDIIASGEYKDVFSNIIWVIDSNGKLTVEGDGDFAVSPYISPSISSSSFYESYKDRAPWYEYRDSIRSAEINVEDMRDASFMFSGCTNLTSIDLSNFDTSRISNMYGMFYNCKKLKNLDLSRFNTRSVRYMSSMFWGCGSLESLDLKSFDTSNVTKMDAMFGCCMSLTSLDVSSFDTRNVSDMSSMFCWCGSLAELDLSGFETDFGVLKSIWWMFEQCSSLVSVDLSGFEGAGLNDLDPLQPMVDVFPGCDNLTTIFTPYNLANANYALPTKLGDVWYMPDGSEITELPTLCDSMIIMRNKIPDIGVSYITATMRKTEYYVGTSIDTFGLIVKYHRNDGSVIMVDDYTTNADEIDMSTAGKKTLIVTYNDGTNTLTEELELTVTEKEIEEPSIIPVENIVLNMTSLSLKVNETATLKATVTPDNASDATITWTSSNKSVAEVEDGVVTAVASGECTITASAGGKEAVCTVKVGEGTGYNLTYTKFSDGIKITGITGVAEGELKIPTQIDGLDVVEIGYKAFYGCSKLTGNLVIPDSVTSIGASAFEGCIGFSGKLIISNNVRQVNKSAFLGCDNISEIYIYNSTLDIGKGGLGEGHTIYGYYGSTAEIYAKYDSDNIFIYLDDLPEFKEYYVKNTKELIEAIGSHRKIILADGVYNIYGGRYSDTSRYLAIRRKIDLSIEAEHPGRAELLLHEKNDPVILIENSAEISIKGCILGHESVKKEEECGDDGSVVTAWDSQNIKLDKCDLYGCGIWGVNAGGNSTITVEGSVIRDCVEGIVESNGNDCIFLSGCILSGNAYNEEWVRRPAFNCWGDVSVQDSIFINNHNYALANKEEKIAFENCSFYNNVWDGGSPQNSGICLNGITWQIDDDVLKLGYPLELENGTIQSETGKVLDYSASSVPWKNCMFSKVQYAEEIEKPDASIKLYKNALLMASDDTATLEVEVTPYNVAVSPVTWMSSDISVAKVENGLVTAVSNGMCTITASVGDKSDTCLIIVSSDGIASGTYQNATHGSDIIWVIDADGKLTVGGKGDFDDLGYRHCAPWDEYTDYIKTAEIIVEGMTDASYMFYECSNLSSIDVSNFDTSQVTNMDSMFAWCSNLSSIDVSTFNTSQVTDMSGMFAGCSNLSSIDASNFDTSQVTNMDSMFAWCRNLSSIDASNFDTSQVTNMSYMFEDCGNLTGIDMSKFNTSQVMDMGDLFRGCNNLLLINTPLNLSQSVELPIATNDIWCDFNGNTYTELPKNLSYSIKLSKNEIPVLSEPYITIQKTKTIFKYGDKLNIDDLIVTYYDRNGVSSQVSNYTTNADEIDMSTLGKKKLIVTYNDGTSILTRELELIVTEKNPEELIPVESIKLNNSQLFLKKGETFKLEATVTPDNSTYQTVTWVSSDTLIAKVKDGEVTAVENGECAIIASVGGKEAVCKVIVSKEAGNGNNENSLNINFQNDSDQTLTYTGSAITPAIKVTYGKKELVAGTDYTIKYSNNIKPGTAKITVTGKGNYIASKSVNFNIVQADINDAVLAGIDENGELVVVSGSKLNTTLYYNNQKLTAKDYTVGGEVNTTRKLLDSDNGKKTIIEGKRNFAGNKEVILRVVNKNSLTKFTVSLDKNKLNSLAYDGKEHYIHDIEGAITVVGKDGNADMKRGMDYTIIYPNNVTDAGVKKFTVVGLGRYTGTVSKSYTIKPAAQTAGEIKVEYEGGNVENIKLPFISTGVTFNDSLTVTYTKNGNLLVLKEGKDYKISYAGNKKVGNKAKFTISFLGNYKGNKKQTRTFTIEKGNLEDAKVIVADKVYKGKAGIYKSAPYVIEPGTNKLLTASNYNVTYYTDETRNVEMKGKNKVTAGDTVYVRIEAKSNGNYKTDNPIIKTYKVLEAVDLSKSKIAFLDTTTGVTTKKTEYTGNPITDREIKVMVNGKSVDKDEDIVVTYVNNINKGKATVIVTGTGEAGCKYIGSKTATFSIVAYSLR